MSLPTRFPNMKQSLWLLSASLAALTFASTDESLAQTLDAPVREISDPGVITTGQAISPAGVQSVFDGRVYATLADRDGTLWVLTRFHLYHLDWSKNQLIKRFAIDGNAGVRALSLDPISGKPIIAFVSKKTTVPGSPTIAKPGQVGLLTPQGDKLVRIGADLGQNAVGQPTVTADKVLVPLLFNNALSIVDKTTNESRVVSTGVAPVAVTAATGLAFVANWGGEKAKAGELSAPTGLEKDADLVKIDARGVAMPGTISVIDVATAKLIATLPVGRHPTALAMDEKAARLYVANTNDDSLSLIDTKSLKVIETIGLKPFSESSVGLAPTAIAIDSETQTLYVACGGVNAVLVYDLKARKVKGMIPTGWYPVSVALDASAKRLVVGTFLGVGSGQKDGQTKRFVHANRGTAHVIDIPDAAQLASYTRAVSENNRLSLTQVEAKKADLSQPASAVPRRVGEPSLIEHVVYIIKENRTYDQLFGDLPKGNGEPSFVMFGQDVTPNQRRLATDFVLLDNFYATGGNSADGHQWVTQANEVSYTIWPGYEGRSYPFDGSDPLAYSARGFIWDAALAQKKTVAVFGEYAPRLSWDQSGRMDMLKAWSAGEKVRGSWVTRSPIPPLDGVLARDFPAYTMAVPDVVRADIFKEHLKGYVAAGKMPNLTLIQLPSDHTSGTSPGLNTTKAMVADNDLALGQVVEALSHSPFWPKMAIFVVEDDAQNGVDHVDGHRTVALAISPYIKRGSVDSTFYAHQSILKTIELMLGLPSLSMFDLIASDMGASFTDKPDFTPYKAIVPTQNLLELNAPLASLSGAAREGALASAAMRWDVPDAVPSALLNKITWHDIKGWNTAYPEPVRAAFSPFQFDLDEDDAPESAKGVSNSPIAQVPPKPVS